MSDIFYLIGIVYILFHVTFWLKMKKVADTSDIKSRSLNAFITHPIESAIGILLFLWSITGSIFCEERIFFMTEIALSNLITPILVLFIKNQKQLKLFVIASNILCGCCVAWIMISHFKLL